MKSRIRRFAFALVLAGLGLAHTTSVASATVIDTDRPRISTQELDFGRNWLLGSPQNGGFLYWDITNGIVRPQLTGYLYINNAAGTCARMQMEYVDGLAVLATRNGGTVCASDGSLHTWSVDLSGFSSPDIVAVNIRLQVQNPNGTYTTVQWLNQDLGD